MHEYGRVTNRDSTVVSTKQATCFSLAALFLYSLCRASAWPLKGLSHQLFKLACLRARIMSLPLSDEHATRNLPSDIFSRCFNHHLPELRGDGDGRRRPVPTFSPSRSTIPTQCLLVLT